MFKEIEALQSSLEDKSEDVTPDEVQEWRHHPVTQAFFADLKSAVLHSLCECAMTEPVDDSQLVRLQRLAAQRELSLKLLDWGKADEDN